MLLHFVKFQAIVKCHERHPFLGSIFQMGDLLDCIGIDYAIRTHSKVKNHRYLILIYNITILSFALNIYML